MKQSQKQQELRALNVEVYKQKALKPLRLRSRTETGQFVKEIKRPRLKTVICAMLIALPVLWVANSNLQLASAKGFEALRSNQIEVNLSPVRFTDEELIAFCKSHGQEWRGGLVCKAIPSDVESHPIRLLLWNKAREYNVDFKLLDAIVDCESDYLPEVKNANSTATGLAQFINSTWVGYAKQRGLNWNLEDRKDAEKNADMLAYVISKGGLHNWEADLNSKACWSKLVASN